MNCYFWELEAILEGLALKRLDEQEQQAIFGFNLRYILNAKKPKLTKVFDKKKAEKKVKNLFSRTSDSNENQQMTKQLKTVTEYFKNKKWR